MNQPDPDTTPEYDRSAAPMHPLRHTNRAQRRANKIRQPLLPVEASDEVARRTGLSRQQVITDYLKHERGQA